MRRPDARRCRAGPRDRRWIRTRSRARAGNRSAKVQRRGRRRSFTLWRVAGTNGGRGQEARSDLSARGGRPPCAASEPGRDRVAAPRVVGRDGRVGRTTPN